MSISLRKILAYYRIQMHLWKDESKLDIYKISFPENLSTVATDIFGEISEFISKKNILKSSSISNKKLNYVFIISNLN